MTKLRVAGLSTAGLVTRCLPAITIKLKERLQIVDKPLIKYRQATLLSGLYFVGIGQWRLDRQEVENALTF